MKAKKLRADARRSQKKAQKRKPGTHRPGATVFYFSADKLAAVRTRTLHLFVRAEEQLRTGTLDKMLYWDLCGLFNQIQIALAARTDSFDPAATEEFCTWFRPAHERMLAIARRFRDTRQLSWNEEERGVIGAALPVLQDFVEESLEKTPRAFAREARAAFELAREERELSPGAKKVLATALSRKRHEPTTV